VSLPHAGEHSVHIYLRRYLEYHSVCPLFGIGTPHPSPAVRVPYIPPEPKGERTHSAAGEGVGESQFGRLEKSLGSGSATLFLNQKTDLGCSSDWILALDFLPSRIWIPYPGVGKTPDPGSGSATLLFECTFTSIFKDKK
jgi:hypothetical protein